MQTQVVERRLQGLVGQNRLLGGQLQGLNRHNGVLSEQVQNLERQNGLLTGQVQDLEGQNGALQGNLDTAAQEVPDCQHTFISHSQLLLSKHVCTWACSTTAVSVGI